ncbi:hypothetical protein KCP74_23475 [Salmonella enterica subsp. enterica]|nr:hypothetical protein KCP74_23475 [Salmonella enterica subsp. enterica]
MPSAKEPANKSRLSDRPTACGEDYPNLSPHAVTGRGGALVVRRGQSKSA